MSWKRSRLEIVTSKAIVIRFLVASLSLDGKGREKHKNVIISVFIQKIKMAHACITVPRAEESMHGSVWQRTPAKICMVACGNLTCQNLHSDIKQRPPAMHRLSHSKGSRPSYKFVILENSQNSWRTASGFRIFSNKMIVRRHIQLISLAGNSPTSAVLPTMGTQNST